VRVPNIDELYSPQFYSGTDSIPSDPCAGAAPALSFEECARTGVTAAQYGTIPDTPFEGLQTIEGGNPDLEPEDADTYAAGVVLSPEFIEALALSVDWYQIKIDQAISTVLASTYMDRCVESGDPAFCSRIHRSTRGGPQGLGGLLWEFDGYIDTTNTNIGYFETSGIDTVLDWSIDTGLGELGLHAVANYVLDYEFQTVPGEPVLACEGMWGATCGMPIPEWRHQLRLTWTTPWNFTLSAAWRHIGEAQADDPFLDDIDAYDYFDLTGLWDIDGRLRLRVGVNNVLDEEPPIANVGVIPTGQGNGNTLPGIYDALGMYWFTGLSAQF
jgi:outer membrane receptor protein involved in Fe transport